MSSQGPSAVAIVNDDLSEQAIWSLLVDEAGFRPVVIESPADGPFRTAEQLVERVEAVAEWAVCDHRLRDKRLALFFGAEAVALLNRRAHTPAILVTSFGKIDADTSIRRYRRNVPVLLASEEFQEPVEIRSELCRCAAEVLDGKIPAWRVPRRTLVCVEDVSSTSSEPVVDVLIPAWSQSKVRLPLALIEEGVRGSVRKDAWLFARVNIDAERDEDLFFEGFEVAEPPDADDGLA